MLSISHHSSILPPPPEHKYKQPQIHKITAIQKNSHQTLNIQNPKKTHQIDLTTTNIHPKAKKM